MKDQSADTLDFLKGHGTGNDFVLIPDPAGVLDLSASRVAGVCDRRFGVGADGVLRVAPSSAMAVDDACKGNAKWFMDYRNADGSVAEMCGNGARVFALYLHRSGLESATEFEFGTRGGVRRATILGEHDVAVTMGRATAAAEPVLIRSGESIWPATAVSVPNPHAVVFLESGSVADLGGIEDSFAEPGAAFPRGVNIEFVEVLAADHLRMRVNERGVGETLSCGTGACAVAWAHRLVHHTVVRHTILEVPGGTVRVGIDDDGTMELSGPAEFVFTGTLDPGWWGS